MVLFFKHEYQFVCLLVILRIALQSKWIFQSDLINAYRSCIKLFYPLNKKVGFVCSFVNPRFASIGGIPMCSCKCVLVLYSLLLSFELKYIFCVG